MTIPNIPKKPLCFIKTSNRRQRRTVVFDYLIGTIAAVALLIAGSENPWFPWLNLAGVIIFGLAGLIAIKLRPVPWR